MNQGVYPLASSMVNQINRLDMISNNLANTNTTGYKQENIVEGSFNHYLDKAKSQEGGYAGGLLFYLPSGVAHLKR